MSEFNFPTEVVDLPSKGLVYPESSPLSSGQVEMKYMTAKEEDILTNQAYISKGIVFDKMLQSLIMDKSIKVDDLIVGDKNALLIAARILGYGNEYKFTYSGEEHTADLTALDNREIDESLFTKGQNRFTFQLPASKITLTFKLLTGKDDRAIDAEIEGYKKINKEGAPELTTRLKQMILAVDGNEDKKIIRDFVDNAFLARDSREFRNYITKFQPDINTKTTITTSDGLEEEIDIPIGLNFFWPES
jgi:hypothetical protein